MLKKAIFLLLKDIRNYVRQYTTVPNPINSNIITEFYHYMKSIGTSETIRIKISKQSLFMQSF